MRMNEVFSSIRYVFPRSGLPCALVIILFFGGGAALNISPVQPLAENNRQDVGVLYNEGNAKSDLGKHPEASKGYIQPIIQYLKSNRVILSCIILILLVGAITRRIIKIKQLKYRGVARYYLERYTEAIDDYTQAIALNPQDARSYHNRGNAKSDLGNHAEAIEDYNKAIELDPQGTQIYHDRGNAKYSLEEYTEAIEDYSKAIEINPQYIQAYTSRADTKSALENFKEAIEDYKKSN